MKTYINPPRSLWSSLTKRPQMNARNVRNVVKEILLAVRAGGDAAIREFSIRFDGAAPDNIRVSQSVRDELADQVDGALVSALQQAISNISAFHRSQVASEESVETCPGVTCFRKAVPIERVGIYIPGGLAPLFSTLLMLAVPAMVAGCREVVLCTPGGKSASLNPVIALAARLLNIEEIYLIGGAQAIAAMAYGTETIRPVQKICGPGNAYVNEAKLQVSAEGTPIDLPAGPSEVLVIADSGANPQFIAADLLAQAEHGGGNQVVLVAIDPTLVEPVQAEVDRQLQSLLRRSIAQEALKESFIMVVSSVEEAMDFSNLYAPEHLMLSVRTPERYVDAVRNAGSVFLGYWAAEALGDYASGTNHVLPTNGAARGFSGVSVDTFMKKITFQSVTSEGLLNLTDAVACMAEAEGLNAHAQSVLRRKEVLCG